MKNLIIIGLLWNSQLLQANQVEKSMTGNASIQFASNIKLEKKIPKKNKIPFLNSAITFDLMIEAKDTGNYDAKISKMINGKKYIIKVYTDSIPITETSQSGTTVYGQISGERVAILINNTYPKDAKFQVRIFNMHGDRIIQSAVVKHNVSTIKFSEIVIQGMFPSPSKKYPSPTNLESRITDNDVPKPTVYNPTVDPVFNTRISMVAKNDDAIANYPKVQTWNSNMRLLRVGSRFYNANTLEENSLTKEIANPYATLCSRSSDYFRWSNIEENRFFVLDSSKRLIKGKIDKDNVDCSNVLEDFSDYERIHIGPHEGNIDYNDKYVLFSGKKINDTTIYLILYDISNHTRVWTKVLPEDSWYYDEGRGTWKPTEMDWISVSPSGRYIVINNIDKNNYQDGLYRYDINFENPMKMQYDYQGTLYSEGGHGDMGYDTEGNEVVVQFMSGLGVHSFNLDNPQELGKELLQSPYGGGHVSCRNTQRLGWCYVTTHHTGYKRVFALKLDGTGAKNIANFSQTHLKSGYGETYGGASPDGSEVIFNSHWDTDTIDTFVVEASGGEITIY